VRPGRSSSNVYFVCHDSVAPLALGDDCAIASSQTAELVSYRPLAHPVYGARSRTVLLVEFMETHKVSPLWHVGLGGPCGSARKNKVPTRADLCYGVVDREIVATKCA